MPKSERLDERRTDSHDALLQLTAEPEGAGRLIARLSYLLAAIALCGCDALLPPFAEQQGDCTLVLRDTREGPVMAAPYRLSLDDAQGGPLVDVLYEADGWAFTTIETTDPAGGRTITGASLESLNGDIHGAVFDRPGMWHIRLSDRRGCVQSFAIEVTL